MNLKKEKGNKREEFHVLVNDCSSIKITVGCSRQMFHCMLQDCIGSE